MRNPRLDYKVCAACGGLVADERGHARAHELLARIRAGLPPVLAALSPSASA